MADRPKCTCSEAPPSPPPTPDNGERVFRETFLWHIPSSDDRAALIRFGNTFDAWMYERGHWGEGDPAWVPSMARALADDIESLAAYAAGITRLCTESRMGPEDLPYCCGAAQWAQQLAAIAASIREVG